MNSTGDIAQSWGAPAFVPIHCMSFQFINKDILGPFAQQLQITNDYVLVKIESIYSLEKKMKSLESILHIYIYIYSFSLIQVTILEIVFYTAVLLISKLKGVKERDKFKCFQIVLSKHFMTIGVSLRVKGLWLLLFPFVGQRLFFHIFQMFGVEEVNRDMLNKYVRMNTEEPIFYRHLE